LRETEIQLRLYMLAEC